MTLGWKKTLLALAVSLLLQTGLIPDVSAFTIIENRIFAEGPFLFKLEVQVYGSGRAKKPPLRVSSVKVKVKNQRASSKTLEIKAIRAYTGPEVYKDLETKGYSVTPGQWVTKYYRLSKDNRPLLGEKGFIQIAFDGFTIQFTPQDRKFQGPIK